MRVGFIGLGRIGAPMAQRLAQGGHELFVFDIRDEAMREAAARCGARAVRSPAEAAAAADAVVISVPGPKEDVEVMLGAQGVLAGARAGLLVVDATTVTVKLSRDHAARCRERRVDHLDAPVSVAQRPDITGTLTVMAGGERSAFERARSILECMGSRVHHVGASGAGTAVKLINQSILVAYMAAFAEGLARGEALGIPRDLILDILDPSAAGSPVIATKYDEIRGRSDKRFAVDSAVRYLAMAQESAQQLWLDTPVLDAALASLRAAAGEGLGADDLIVARHRYHRDA